MYGVCIAAGIVFAVAVCGSKAPCAGGARVGAADPVEAIRAAKDAEVRGVGVYEPAASRLRSEDVMLC